MERNYQLTVVLVIFFLLSFAGGLILSLVFFFSVWANWPLLYIVCKHNIGFV